MQVTSQKTFSIKTTAQLVALNSHTIRAWEKRYKALDPYRNETNNRRVYTPADVERLLTLSKLVKSGHVIGHIARLSTEQLKSMLKNSQETNIKLEPHLELTDHLALEQCWNSLINNDFSQLYCELNSAIQSHSILIVLDSIVFALLKKIKNGLTTSEIIPPQSAVALDVIKTQLFEKSLEWQISSRICRQPNNGSRDDKIICLIPNFTDFSTTRMHALGALLASQGYIPYIIESKNSAEFVAEFVESINTNFIIIDSPEVENGSIYYQDFLKKFLRSIPSKCTVWQFATSDNANNTTADQEELSLFAKRKIATVHLNNVSQTIESQIGKLLRVSPKKQEHLIH